MTQLQLVQRAAAFAAAAHRGQVRKGDAGAPYVNHLAEVALLVLSAAPEDAALAAAAWLHDAPEKGDTPHADISALFGDDVAALVGALTDPPGLDDAARKAHQVTIASALPPRAKLLKLADKTSNIADVATHRPRDWDDAALSAYVSWADDVAWGLVGLSPVLDAAWAGARALIAPAPR